MRCDSSPGQGTTFTIYLKPVAGSSAEEEVPNSPQERAAGGEERVLVVDDEPAVRRLLARILRSRGYDVLETEDGHLALAFMSTANRPTELPSTGFLGKPFTPDQIEAKVGELLDGGTRIVGTLQ